MAVATEPPGLEGLVSIFTALRSLAQWTLGTTQAFETTVHETNDTVEAVRKTANKAKRILDSLGAYTRELTDKYDLIDRTTPHSPYINSLSEDILSDILVIATESEYDSGYYGTLLARVPHFPEIAMTVCRGWRDLAGRCPMIWSCIRLDIGHSAIRTKKWLRRCAQAPLELQWIFEDNNGCKWKGDHDVELAEILLPYLSQVTRLRIHCPHLLPIKLKAVLSFPVLRSMSLRSLKITQSGHSAETDILTATSPLAPALQILYIDTSPVVWNWKFSNLRVLRLRSMNNRQSPSWSQLRDILTASMELRELELVDIGRSSGAEELSSRARSIYPD